MSTYTVDARAFAAAVKQAGEIVEARNTIPILGQAIIACSRGAVRVIVSNRDRTLRTAVAAPDAWRRRDVFSVDFQALRKTVAAIKGAETLRLARDGARLTIAAPPFARVFALADGAGAEHTAPRSFPFGKRPAEKPRYECAMTAADWRAALADVADEMCDQETRYYLNGAYIEPLRGEPSRMVATDGHRLAIRQFRPDREFIRECGGYILPRDAASALARIAGDDETVTGEFRADGVTFTGAAWRLTSKLIDGTFPDYRRVMPRITPDATIVDVASAPLAAFAGVAAKLSAARAPAVSLYINGRIEAALAGADNPVDLAETLAYVEKTGPDVTIGLNANYLKSALRGLDAARLTIGDPAWPVLFTSPAAPLLQRVVMPSRV